MHLWTTTRDDAPPGIESFDEAQAQGFHSLLHLAQALDASSPAQPRRIEVVSNRLHDVAGDEPSPAKATVLGACAVIPQEYEALSCRASTSSSPPRVRPTFRSSTTSSPS